LNLVPDLRRVVCESVTLRGRDASEVPRPAAQPHAGLLGRAVPLAGIGPGSTTRAASFQRNIRDRATAMTWTGCHCRFRTSVGRSSTSVVIVRTEV